MRTLLATLILFCAVGAYAQATNRITAKITVTTATSNNFAFTLNGNTRTFTNDVTAAASQITTNHTVAGSASNLYHHIIATPFSGPVVPLNFTNGSNVIFLRGALGQAMSVTILSNWATVEYSTQVFSSGLIAVRVPIASESASVQTKVASELVTGINAYTTNAFATNSPALTNHLSLGPQVQRTSNKVFEAFHATGGNVSNSFFTNITRANIGALRSTNALIHAGSATNLSVVNSPSVSTTNLYAISADIPTLTVGQAYITNMIAYDNIKVDGDGVTAFADILFGGTFSIGFDATGSGAFYIENVDSGQVMVRMEYGGDSVFTSPTVISNHLSVRTNFTANGLATFQAGVTETNVATFGTNRIAARVDFTSRANAALANGNNSGVILGSNVYVRLSGPSAAYTNAGFAAEFDGSFHVLQFDNPVNNMTILDNSGLDATAGNRIRTGTGGALNFTNNPVMLQVIYDGTAGRWRIINGSDYR